MKGFKADAAKIKRRMEDDSAYDQHAKSWRTRKKIPSSHATVIVTEAQIQQAMLASGDIHI